LVRHLIDHTDHEVLVIDKLTIPVSIAGWGVRESMMVLAFSYAGLVEADGLAVSILFGVVNLAVGSIGGIVWVASGFQWRSVKNIEVDTLAHDPTR
jgi:hypothetical protein